MDSIELFVKNLDEYDFISCARSKFTARKYIHGSYMKSSPQAYDFTNKIELLN